MSAKKKLKKLQRRQVRAERDKNKDEKITTN